MSYAGSDPVCEYGWGGMHSHMCVHEQGGQGTTLGIILQDASYLVFL